MSLKTLLTTKLTPGVPESTGVTQKDGAEGEAHGKDWGDFQPSRGRGVLQVLALQISACSYLWLTVIYADFFFSFLI